MASEKISMMPAVGTLTGAELIPVVQGGVNKKMTIAQLLAFIFRGCSTGGSAMFWNSFNLAPDTDPQIQRLGGGALAINGLQNTGATTCGSPSFSVDGGGNLTQNAGTPTFNGSGTFTTFTIVNGIINAAS